MKLTLYIGVEHSIVFKEKSVYIISLVSHNVLDCGCRKEEVRCKAGMISIPQVRKVKPKEVSF